MLECRLEILLLVPYSTIKTCTFEYAAPEGSLQQRTGKMTHICGICEKTKLHELWLAGSQRLICIKQVLSYLFVKPFYQNFIYKGQDNPHTLHTDQVCSSGRNSTKFWNNQTTIPFLGMSLSSSRVSRQVLKHLEMMMRFFRSFHG
jgi:hypothetical protein